MKYMGQFWIILAVTCAGEALKAFLPLPIPASIYGLVLMLVLLATGVVKLRQVEDAGAFLVEIMPVMFIPAGVGLLNSWGDLRSMLVPVLVITVVSSFLVMTVTGKVTERLVRDGDGAAARGERQVIGGDGTDGQGSGGKEE